MRVGRNHRAPPARSSLRTHRVRGVHRSVQALEKDIRTWIATSNTDPKPYVWTKTADEILERLASYLNRIPDSEDQPYIAARHVPPKGQWS